MKASCRRFRCWQVLQIAHKMIEKGEAAKSDACHIERSGALLGFQIGLRLAQMAADVWVFAAQIPRTRLTSDRSSRPAKLEYRCDHI